MEGFFQSVSRQMTEQIKLISNEILHSGMKGDSGEEIILQFLKKYLPKKYTVTKGKIVDFSGNESKQIDILVYDAFNTIPFYDDGKTSIIPVENTYAVIEVKTTINKTKLFESLALFESVFDLLSPLEYQNLGRGDLAIKDLSPINHFKRHPKCFLIGLTAAKSTTTEALMKNYLAYVRKREIKFPLISFCGILDGDCFVDTFGEKEEEIKYSKDPCEVYLNESGSNSLLLFLLNLVGTISFDSETKHPDYILYLNSYKKINPRKRLSDGWLLH